MSRRTRSAASATPTGKRPQEGSDSGTNENGLGSGGPRGIGFFRGLFRRGRFDPGCGSRRSCGGRFSRRHGGLGRFRLHDADRRGELDRTRRPIEAGLRRRETPCLISLRGETAER